MKQQILVILLSVSCSVDESKTDQHSTATESEHSEASLGVANSTSDLDICTALTDPTVENQKSFWEAALKIYDASSYTAESDQSWRNQELLDSLLAKISQCSTFSGSQMRSKKTNLETCDIQALLQLVFLPNADDYPAIELPGKCRWGDGFGGGTAWDLEYFPRQ